MRGLNHPTQPPACSVCPEEHTTRIWCWTALPWEAVGSQRRNGLHMKSVNKLNCNSY